MYRGVTCVAFYGHKPPPLVGLIEHVSNILRTKLRQDFEPYDIQQVHATVIGLEADIDASPLHNLNFRKRRQQSATMDVTGFRHSMLQTPRIPFTVQIGGFADRDYPFTSRSFRPYTRSFSIQGDKAVVMGWPVVKNRAEADEYPLTLHELRISAQAFGVLHDYHATPTDVDNDFYFRVGLLNPAIDETLRRDIETEVRQVLASRSRVLQLSASALFLASYLQNALPLSSTLAYSLNDPNLTDSEIPRLYGPAARLAG